jgi:hypothetical protein
VGTAQTLSPTQAFMAAAAAYKGVIAGRKLRVVTAEIDPASTTYASDFQAACEKLIVDGHANVVLTADVIGNDGFSACVARAGVAQINTGYGSVDLDTYRRFPHQVNLSVPDADARMRSVIDGAIGAGTLHAHDTVGVVVEGCPFDGRVYDSTVLPRLRAVGVTAVVRQDTSCITGFSGLGGAASTMGSAVLRFRSSAVDHVLFVSNFEGPLLLFFTQQAENQGYRPSYLLSSSGVPATVIGDIPAGQRTALSGDGTLVSTDVTAGAQATTAEQRACQQAMKDAGHPVASGSQVDALAAYDACDAFSVLAAALHITRGASSGSALRSAMNSVRRLRLAGNVDGSLHLMPTSPTAPARTRHFAYSGSCACLSYTRPSQAL